MLINQIQQKQHCTKRKQVMQILFKTSALSLSSFSNKKVKVKGEEGAHAIGYFLVGGAAGEGNF